MAQIKHLTFFKKFISCCILWQIKGTELTILVKPCKWWYAQLQAIFQNRLHLLPLIYSGLWRSRSRWETHTSFSPLRFSSSFCVTPSYSQNREDIKSIRQLLGHPLGFPQVEYVWKTSKGKCPGGIPIRWPDGTTSTESFRCRESAALLRAHSGWWSSSPYLVWAWTS